MTAHYPKQNLLENPPFSSNYIYRPPKNNCHYLEPIANISSQSLDTKIVYNINHNMSKEDISSKDEIGTYNDINPKISKEDTYYEVEIDTYGKCGKKLSTDNTYEDIAHVVHIARSEIKKNAKVKIISSLNIIIFTMQ